MKRIIFHFPMLMLFALLGCAYGNAAEKAPSLFKEGTMWVGKYSPNAEGKNVAQAAFIKGTKNFNGKDYLMLWTGEVVESEEGKLPYINSHTPPLLVNLLKEEDGKIYSHVISDDPQDLPIFDFTLTPEKDSEIYTFTLSSLTSYWNQNRIDQLNVYCINIEEFESCGYIYSIIFLSNRPGKTSVYHDSIDWTQNYPVNPSLPGWIEGVGGFSFPTDYAAENYYMFTSGGEYPVWTKVYADGQLVLDLENVKRVANTEGIKEIGDNNREYLPKYSLDGRRIENPTNEIYIQGGRKIKN